MARRCSNSAAAAPKLTGKVFHEASKRVSAIERKLAKLQDAGGQREYEALRTTYERMLERGPERFQVKPSGLPVMDHLYDDLPNFTEVLDDVKRQLALCQDSRDALEITPMLLLGPPGIGKTHLMHAIGHYVLRHDRALKLTYISAERFMNEILLMPLRRDETFVHDSCCTYQ